MVVKLKRVLVTGASGFIGRYALEGLVKRGYEVHAVSRLPLDSFVDVNWHVADIFNSIQIENIFKKVRPSHLLHLAWNVEQKTYMMNMENFRWVTASLEILNSFQRNGGVRCVFAGTCAEYDWNYRCLIEDVTPCLPQSNYGICKNCLNEMMKAFCQSCGISAAWGRIFFLYGPHESESRLVASIVKSLLLGKPALCTSGEQYRDFLYVEDVADAFCELLDNTIIGSVNIASGQPIKVRDLVFKIANTIGNPELLHMGAIQSKPGEQMLLCASVDRLNKEVGWKPRYNINEGIDKTIYWWKKHMEINGE